MDVEEEIKHLAGETLALSLLLSSVLNRLSEIDPVQAGAAIWVGFDDATKVLDASVEKYGAYGPEHFRHAYGTLERIRGGIFPAKPAGLE